MSYPKDSSFLDMRSRIRTPVLKTRMILNELESMVKSPGQNKSFNELENRRWINTSLNSSFNSPHRRIVGSTTKFISASTTSKPTDGSSKTRASSSGLRSIYSSQTPGRWNSEINPKSIVKSVSRRSNDFSNKSTEEGAPLTSIDELEKVQSLLNNKIDKPIVLDDDQDMERVEPEVSPRKILRPLKRRNIDNGYKSNVFSAFDENDPKRTKLNPEMEKLQSLLKKDLVKECLLNGDGMEEFTFDKPEVRGPRKPVVEVVPPVIPKITVSTAAETKSASNTAFSTPTTSNKESTSSFGSTKTSTIPTTTSNKESFSLSSGTSNVIAQIPAFVSTSSAPKWECPTCMVRNESSKNECPCCMTPKPVSSTSKWECPTCMVRNESSKNECPCCMTPKPGSKKSSDDGPVAKIPAPTSFKPTTFKAPDNAALSLFGQPSKPVEEPTVVPITSLPPTTSTQPFKFGGGPAFSSTPFGLNATENNTPIFGSKTTLDQTAKESTTIPTLTSAQPFKFVTNPAAPSLTSSLKAPTTNGSSPFAFGNNAPSAPTVPTVPSLSFAQKAPSTNGTAAPFAFGSTDPTAPLSFSFASKAPSGNGAAPFVFGNADITARPSLSFSSTVTTNNGTSPFVFGGATPAASSLPQIPSAPAFVPLNPSQLLGGNPFASTASTASSIGRRKLTAKRKPR